MEMARELEVDHLLMASTSSVYGANTEMPFKEGQKTETPLTLYAATKKANEGMAHSYSPPVENPDNHVPLLYGLWSLGTP